MRAFDNLHIILLIHVYELAKYVRLNRKDQLKNMRGTTLQVAMLVDVIESHNIFRVFTNV